MEKKKLLKKEIIVIALSIALFFPITYATFKNKIFGSGTANLAIWNVTLNQANVVGNLAIMPAPNESVASYTVNVNSVSEVSIIYSIVIDNLPTGVSVDLDNQGYVQENNHKVIFTDVATIPYNDPTKSRAHTLTFKASTTTAYVTNNEVNIDVKIKQKISNNNGNS